MHDLVRLAKCVIKRPEFVDRLHAIGVFDLLSGRAENATEGVEVLHGGGGGQRRNGVFGRREGLAAVGCPGSECCADGECQCYAVASEGTGDASQRDHYKIMLGSFHASRKRDSEVCVEIHRRPPPRPPPPPPPKPPLRLAAPRLLELRALA